MRQILRLFLVLLLALAVSSGVRGTGYAQDASYLDSAIDRLETMSGTSFSASGAGGAGDDQQVPDNQQGGGGGAEITKTFELTLNGTPSADQGFVAVSIAVDPENDSVLFFSVVEFCGEVPDVSAELDQLEAELEADGIDVTVEYIQNDDPCTGDGTVYAESVTYPAGVQAFFSFTRLDQDNQTGETIFEGEETLDSDMTNTAFYDFGSTGADDDQKDTGAGDDQQTPDNQQDDTQDDGTGAGDDQQTPDNQQDDTQDDGAGAGDEQDDIQDDGSGAGDEQDDTQDDGTGAGDDQQTPDNQQDDTQDDGSGAGDTQDDTQDDGAGGGDTQDDTQDDSTGGGDIQDDQQGETPEELPATGAGGMAPVGLPVGGVLTALAAVAALGLRLMHR